jgi:hypothetical protein
MTSFSSYYMLIEIAHYTQASELFHMASQDHVLTAVLSLLKLKSVFIFSCILNTRFYILLGLKALPKGCFCINYVNVSVGYFRRILRLSVRGFVYSVRPYRVKWAKSPHWAMMPHHEFLRNRCTRKQHMLHSLKFFQ